MKVMAFGFDAEPFAIVYFGRYWQWCHCLGACKPIWLRGIGLVRRTVTMSNETLPLLKSNASEDNNAENPTPKRALEKRPSSSNGKIHDRSMEICGHCLSQSH